MRMASALQQNFARIDAAFARIEEATARLAAEKRRDAGDLRLRSEVRAVLEELDRLIGEVERG